MAYNFEPTHWSAEISEVTGQPEYQTALIRMTDPSLENAVYDPDTGEYVVAVGGTDYGEGVFGAGIYEAVENPVIYEGRARIIGVRWGTNNGNVQQANPTTISALRVQLPHGAQTARVKKGTIVSVLDGFRNPALESLSITVTSDLQGASAASRTFECSVDADSVVQA